MSLPQNVQKELEERDELILALEMLTVDQACRLLALESVVTNMAESRNVRAVDVKARITREAKRFHQHFEGDSLSGFVERAQRIASELLSTSGGEASPKKATATSRKPTKKPSKPAAKPRKSGPISKTTKRAT